MSRAEADRLLAESMNKPHEGRVYDYFLGGSSNFAADREFGKAQIQAMPDVVWAAKQNRGFMRRAVQHLVNQGIRQFVDLGSGLPTEGNVHQLAQRYAPDECRVVYIDHDPVASAHGYLLLEEEGTLDRHFPINGDFLNYHQVWDAVQSTGLIDPTQPIGLLAVGLLYFVPREANPGAALDFFREQMPSGSLMALSHIVPDDGGESGLDDVMQNYGKSATSSITARRRDEVETFFGDWEIQDPPGLTWSTLWTAKGVETEMVVGDMDPSSSHVIAAVARKR
jgi:O-methyltransferase involved in polyketide biosynthesis